MPKKRFSAEQIVVVLRQIEVLMSRLKNYAVFPHVILDRFSFTRASLAHARADKLHCFGTD